MKSFTRFLSLSSCFSLILGMNYAFAGEFPPDLICPNNQYLKQAMPFASLPYQYLKSTKEMAYFSLSVLIDKNAPAKSWIIFLNPVLSKPLENVQLKIKSTLGLLYPTTVLPTVYQAPYFNFDIEENKDDEVDYLPFCFYEVPGNTKLRATAVYIDSEDYDADDDVDNEDFLNKFKHNKKFHQKILKLTSDVLSISK